MTPLISFVMLQARECRVIPVVWYRSLWKNIGCWNSAYAGRMMPNSAVMYAQ